MFKEISKSVIESDEGFSVERIGNCGIKYKKGSEAFFVDSEIMVGSSGVGMIIYKNRIRSWESPRGHYEAIDNEKRNEIIESISKAFLFWGDTFKIEE